MVTQESTQQARLCTREIGYGGSCGHKTTNPDRDCGRHSTRSIDHEATIATVGDLKALLQDIDDDTPLKLEDSEFGPFDEGTAYLEIIDHGSMSSKPPTKAFVIDPLT